MRIEYTIHDKRSGEEIDRGYVDARNVTEARKIIIDAARQSHDIPTNARDCGYVPIRDWRFKWINYKVQS